MARGPSVLALDDGELDDVQAILEELGVPFARVRGGAIVDGTPPPTDLLISTPRRIDAVARVSGGHGADPPVRLVVVEEDSNALRKKLRECGFDYLVRRPVHPEALRLLLMRCLYRGDERRREPRVAVGFEVGFRTGLKTRRAVLADLSVVGCRLLSESGIAAGRRIRVNVPEALETGDSVTITGRVLRVDRPKEPDRAHLYSAAVVFDEMKHDARDALEVLIEDLSRGPATLRRDQPTPAGPPETGSETGGEAGGEAESEASPETARAPAKGAPEATGAEAQADADEASQDAAIEVDLRVESVGTRPDAEPAPGARERRQRRRVSYSHTVPAFGKRALRVLVGRDLSVAGMRIEPLPGLALGDRLHLAIYGDAGESPFLAWATVRRDDGPSGMVLAFDALDPDLGERLERLVGSLPSVESLHDTEVQAMGTVVSEILTE